MKTHAWMLFLAVALPLPSVAGAAEDVAQTANAVAQQKNDCKQEEQQKGAGEINSAVVCAIKVMFQSRIRRRKDTEPVEMTVGSPPLQTEDTDTPGPNNWEINIGLDSELAGSERTLEAPTLDVNYGVGERLQFTYGVPYVWAKHEQADPSGAMRIVDEHGVGDSTFGVKYRFYDNKDTGLSFAIYPQLEFRTPGANPAVSDHATSFRLPLAVTKEFEQFSIGANIGIDVSAGERRYFASFGAGRRLTDHVAVMGEIVGTNLNATDEKHVLLNFGIRRKISDTQSLSASLGRDVYSGGDERERTYFTLSYQKLFGK